MPESGTAGRRCVDVDITVSAHPLNPESNGEPDESVKLDLVTVAVAVPFSKVNVATIEWLLSAP